MDSKSISEVPGSLPPENKSLDTESPSRLRGGGAVLRSNATEVSDDWRPDNLLSELTWRPLGAFPGLKDSDYIFILANWQKSYRNSPYAGVIRNNHYYSVMKNTIDDLLARGMQIFIACDKLDFNNLVGFIAFEQSEKIPVIHYLFVKPDFRENGIAQQLLKLVVKDGKYLYTHKTSYTKLFNNGYYSPVIARRKNLEPCYLPIER